MSFVIYTNYLGLSTIFATKVTKRTAQEDSGYAKESAIGWIQDVLTMRKANHEAREMVQ